MSEDPIAGLKQIAMESSEKAIYWRRRFRLMAWFNVSMAVLWLAMGVFWLVAADHLLTFLCSLALIALGLYAVKHARDIFREATKAYATYMRIRQECLESIDIIDK